MTNSDDLPPELLRVLEAIRTVTGRDTPTRTNRPEPQFTVACPAHDDSHASLSIGWRDGTVLMKCHAGCSTADILVAIGLSTADLAPVPHIEAVYPYEDENGVLLYEVLRWQPKDFTQRRPDPDRPGKHINSVKGVERVPFNLPEVAEAVAHGSVTDTIYIVEGEKDVLSIRALNDTSCIATCNQGGTGMGWKDEHSRYLVGFSGTIVVIPDLDRAGYRHALATGESIERVCGVSVEFRVPARGKDISDHLGELSLAELRLATRAEITELAEMTPSGRLAAPSGNSRAVTHKLTPASEIVSRKQRFFWKDRIPMGIIALFAGTGGVGKSSFAIWLGAQAQHGRLPGDLAGKAAVVAYVSVEDDWDTQVKARLVAAGVVLEAFHKLSIEMVHDIETGEYTPKFPENVPHLKAAILEVGADLVIIDPLVSTMQGDNHRVEDVRALMDPLARVARETDCLIVGIMHFRKGAGNVSESLSGSHAFRDAARSVLLFAYDIDEDQVVMTQDKNNYAERQDSSLAFRIVSRTVLLDDGNTTEVGAVEMIGESSTSVSDIINRTPNGSGGRQRAHEWLRDLMITRGGRVLTTEVVALGKAAGYSESQLKLARKRLTPPVESRKQNIVNGAWELFWPAGRSEEGEEAEEAEAEESPPSTSSPSSAGSPVWDERNRRV